MTHKTVSNEVFYIGILVVYQNYAVSPMDAVDVVQDGSGSLSGSIFYSPCVSDVMDVIVD